MPQIQTRNDVYGLAQQIRVSGTVQGVGFRPFVWQLAQQFNLTGRVWNDAKGVVIQVWGDAESISQFKNALSVDAPPLSQIECIVSESLTNATEPVDFQIIESQSGDTLTNVSADAATCLDCLAEVNDPSNRRYRYPFTNCTHCGPRFSIIKTIPYDRSNTSMAAFNMCPQCQQEYTDPTDRRFHAQPNACPVCGPSLWLEDKTGQRLVADFIDELAHAASLLEQGYIVAIKGIGGFHLACDATNAATVSQLRQRKQRYHKPFAMMARDIGVIRRYANVSAEEEALLKDRAAPIVILSMHKKQSLPVDVAPAQTRLGFMLPYTPLHSLLLQALDFPIVLTSGNRSDEAQCISNAQAQTQLADIADYFLLHDREIVNRLDDSVARIVDGKPQLLRRARGYAPQSIKLPAGFETCVDILAMGAELKNTFCLLKDGKAIVSQHQGDLEDTSVFNDYRHNLKLYTQLYEHKPAIIAVDQHPNYVSTHIGEQLAAQQSLPLQRIQHHHAHIAACMIEHGLPLTTEPVLGICMDGLGYAEEGSIWGGEFLLADYVSFQRLASFQPIAMPGGNKAMLEPWRNTLAHLETTLGWQQVVAQFPANSFVQYMQDKPVDTLLTMIRRGINSPLASSAGRLFDAVAALLGLCRDGVSYEGQAAMQLEALAEQRISYVKPYQDVLAFKSADRTYTLDWHCLWQAMLSDISHGISAAETAGRFHLTLSTIIVSMVEKLAQQSHFSAVVLSGGVTQNQLITRQLSSVLSIRDYHVLIPRQFPANDGGISLGQAAIAAASVLHS